MAKVKRKKIDWCSVIRDIGDLDLNGYFYLCCNRYYQKNKRFGSRNKIAYCVLRHWYGDKVLNAYRITGDWQFALSVRGVGNV